MKEKYILEKWYFYVRYYKMENHYWKGSEIPNYHCSKIIVNKTAKHFVLECRYLKK